MSQRGWMLRMAVFAAGIFLMSAGIALSIRSNLGTTPISTLPVAVNAWNLRISVGMATFLMNALFVVAQFCLLRSRFPARLWLQIPAVLFFGWTIDLCLATFGFVAPEAWAMRLIVNLTAIPVLAFGVWLCLVSDILLMPGDGLASAIGAVLHVDFAWAKVGTDTGIVITAALFGIATAGRVTGIREGTLLAMILVGVLCAPLPKTPGEVAMAMPQKDDLIEEIKRTDLLLEWAVQYGDEAEAERLREKLRKLAEL